MRPWIHASSLAVGMVLGAFAIAPATAVYSHVPDRSVGADVLPGNALQRANPQTRPEPRQPRAQDRVVRMTDRDRTLLVFQKVCPVCDGDLRAKKTPGKVVLTVFVCGPKCIAEFDKAPRETIVKWADVCQAHARAMENR